MRPPSALATRSSTLSIVSSEGSLRPNFDAKPEAKLRFLRTDLVDGALFDSFLANGSGAGEMGVIGV